MQNQFWFGNKVRVDDFIGDAAHNGQSQLVALNNQLFNLNPVFHKNTPNYDNSYFTKSFILSTASLKSRPA